MSTDVPEDEGYLPIRTISTMTGVNPITLRAWERRYGLISPVRTESGHRLYSRDDLARIQRIVGLLQQGVSIGQVSQIIDVHPDRHEGVRTAEPAAQLQTWVQRLDEIATVGDVRGLEQMLDHIQSHFSATYMDEHIVTPWLMSMSSGSARHALVWPLMTARLLPRLYAQNQLFLSRQVTLLSEQLSPLSVMLGLALQRNGFRVNCMGFVDAEYLPAILAQQRSEALIVADNHLFTPVQQTSLRMRLRLPLFVVQDKTPLKDGIYSLNGSPLEQASLITQRLLKQ